MVDEVEIPELTIAEQRTFGRIERMRIYAESLSIKLTLYPKHKKVDLWKTKLIETQEGIELQILEAKVAVIKARKRGVEIQVPVATFSMKPKVPA